MQAAGPLMVEHRLIEKVIAVIGKEAVRIKAGGAVDVLFIERAMDFIRTYTDRCHHGKEENILFRELAKKPLTPELKKTMRELEEQHVMGRQTVAKIEAASQQYQKGATSAVGDIVHLMEIMATFYPKHIEREEKSFFFPCMEYFNDAEMASMLNEFVSADKNLLHEKYNEIYVDLMKH
jgi:hemerythrin-like domain-containing protein